MDLKQSDFVLTDEQLLEIDRNFRSLTVDRAQAVEAAHHGVSVTYEFSPLGRPVRVHSQLVYFEDVTEIAVTEAPFTNADVLLTEEQLHEVNRHFSAISTAQAQADEDKPQSPCVTFEFGPGWRSFAACFTGPVDGHLLRQCYEWPPDVWNRPADQGAEDRLAKVGFFLNDDLKGTTEGDKLAAALGDIFQSMKKSSRDKQ